MQGEAFTVFYTQTSLTQIMAVGSIIFLECTVHVPFYQTSEREEIEPCHLALSLPFSGSQQVLRHGLESSARLI